MCEAKINKAKRTNCKILSITYVYMLRTPRPMKKKFYEIRAMYRMIYTLAKTRNGIALDMTMMA